jgi:hypothetical protein
MMRLETQSTDFVSRWPRRFANAVRFLIAPVLLFSGGFSTADFVLSGLYTWPRTSRVLVLTLTMAVLAYEFVYKEQKALEPNRPGSFATRVLITSCVLPYVLGIVALVLVVRL